MTNTEFKAINNEALAMISGGEGLPSNPFDFIIKGYQDPRIQQGFKELGVRIMQKTGQTANDFINKVRNWF